jgi:adenine-specific DNA-methyltransferase
VIKYLGSKRLLVPRIVAIVRALPRVRSVLDLFSGTSRVGIALKLAGLRVIANDHLSFAHALATCYVQADRDVWQRDAERLVAELDRMPGAPGWFTETYCERTRFFRPENGARIEAIRDAIAAMRAAPELEAILLTALLEAADRVDSTTGVQMAFLKRWAPRALQPLALRVPELTPRGAHGRSEAHCADALRFAGEAAADVAYVDPPYNQHSYLGNYHVWETLVRWDRPALFGRVCKRDDVRTRKSAFNSKPAAAGAFAELIGRLRARWVVVSFSDEGYLTRAQIEQVLAARGEVAVLSRGYPRYVGAKIGIHAPDGAKVGTVSHLTNTEHLYVCGPGAGDAARAAAAAVG